MRVVGIVGQCFPASGLRMRIEAIANCTGWTDNKAHREPDFRGIAHALQGPGSRGIQVARLYRLAADLQLL